MRTAKIACHERAEFEGQRKLGLEFRLLLNPELWDEKNLHV